MFSLASAGLLLTFITVAHPAANLKVTFAEVLRSKGPVLTVVDYFGGAPDVP